MISGLNLILEQTHEFPCSYVQDHETELYYLQSRYYNPEVGRFLNSDIYAATGQGLLGNNMFAYCLNNPLLLSDNQGSSGILTMLRLMGMGGVIGAVIGAVGSAIIQYATTGEIDVGSVAVAFGSGFVGGAIVASPLGATGQKVAGAVIGGATYYVGCAVTGKEATFVGAATATAAGFVSGYIGGGGLDEGRMLSHAIDTTADVVAREARRANQDYAQKRIANVTANLVNNVVSSSSFAGIRYAIGTQVANFISACAADIDDFLSSVFS